MNSSSETLPKDSGAQDQVLVLVLALVTTNAPQTVCIQAQTPILLLPLVHAKESLEEVEFT